MIIHIKVPGAVTDTDEYRKIRKSVIRSEVILGLWNLFSYIGNLLL